MYETLISLAKAAILVGLQQPSHYDLQTALTKFPQLKNPAASFVTLTQKDGTLRGCIGSLDAFQPLYKDIIRNAQSAAFRDPRFKPVTLKEIPDLKVEISLLSNPQKLDYTTITNLKQKIHPFRDGVILRYQGSHATYLPQVWEQLSTFDTFFSHLCQKAKLDSNCLELHPQIAIYQVTKFKE